MTEGKLARTTPEGAVAILEKLMDRFMVPDVNVDFGCAACGQDYGCYIPQSNTICFQPDNGQIPIYVVYHEFGHRLEDMYAGETGYTYAQGEAFARALETIYLATNGQFLNWHCPCGSDHVRLLPDGSIQCLECGDIFFAPLYDQSLVTK